MRVFHSTAMMPDHCWRKESMIRPSEWNNEALDKFKETLEETLSDKKLCQMKPAIQDIPANQAKKNKDKEWQVIQDKDIKGVINGFGPLHEPNYNFNRGAVLKLVAAKREDVDTKTACAAVMQWGGMRKGGREEFFDMAKEGWLEVAEGIRAGSINRKDAYDAFADLRRDGKLKWVGPAYFTKLIYFLTPRKKIAPAYIMDQWVGCSINLLLDNEGVVMKISPSFKTQPDAQNRSFTVSDKNAGENYEEFCKAADELGEVVGRKPDEIDIALFSKGGRKREKEKWRKYVVDKRVASLVSVRDRAKE